jgi:hypothetical protein
LSPRLATECISRRVAKPEKTLVLNPGKNRVFGDGNFENSQNMGI